MNVLAGFFLSKISMFFCCDRYYLGGCKILLVVIVVYDSSFNTGVLSNLANGSSKRPSPVRLKVHAGRLEQSHWKESCI